MRPKAGGWPPCVSLLPGCQPSEIIFETNLPESLRDWEKSSNFAAEIRNLWRDMAAREYCDIVELF